MSARLASLYRDRSDLMRRLAEVDEEIALELAVPAPTLEASRRRAPRTRAAVVRAPAGPVDPELKVQVAADLARMGYRTGT